MTGFPLCSPSIRRALRNALIGGGCSWALCSCSIFTSEGITQASGNAPEVKTESIAKIAKTSQSILHRKNKEYRPIPPNTALWPESWKTYHKRFNNYVKARKKYWPQPEIKFLEPFGLEWDLIVSKNWGSYTSQQRDGIQFFRYGRHYLTKGFSDSEGLLKSFASGEYTASVWRPAGHYQHMSPPFYFNVIVDKGKTSEKTTTRIEPYHPESDDELFPNQWWYYHKDFFWWDTGGRPPEKNGKKPERPHVRPGLTFFTNLRPFEPTLSMTEAEGENGPVVNRNLLPPKLESLLELRLYHEGRLMKKEPATGIDSWSFDHGPGHYTFLIVAPDNNGGALIVARPFQAWFPDEEDGVLRIVPLDTDKDGIPDYWEKWYDMDPKNPKDADKPYQGNRETSYLDYFKSQKFDGEVR